MATYACRYILPTVVHDANLDTRRGSPDGVQVLARGLSAGTAAPRRLEPTGFLPREQWQQRAETRECGEGLLREGKAGFLTVAGGQGTRLGLRGPKGCYPISVIRRATLFQIIAEKVLACRRRYGAPVNWLVMVSPLIRESTAKFFRDHDHFGLPEGEIEFFAQALYPTLDPDGRLLLAENGGLLSNPNGHGGLVEALRETGLLETLRRRGVEELFCFQVDNPLVRVPDAGFLGAHRLGSSQMSSKVVAKAFPEEKLGSIGLIDGAPGVIEYSDLDRETTHARDAQGRLTNLTEVYLVESNQWTYAAALPWALSAYALVPFEGKLFILGGWDGVQYRDEVIRYTPDLKKYPTSQTLTVPLNAPCPPAGCRWITG